MPSYRDLTLGLGLGWMLAQDPAAAGGFARTVVGLLRPDLPAPPAKLLCEPEVPIPLGALRGYRERRADLLFRSPRGAYVLIFEAKLNAPTGRKQVADYLKARPRDIQTDLKPDARIEVALVGNKPIVPRDRTKSSRWLGVLTWTDLLEGLEALRFADPERAERWRTLLRKYRADGALGVDADLATQDPDQMLAAVALRLVRQSDRRIRKHGGSVRALPWHPTGEGIVHKTRNGADMQIVVRTAARARFRTLQITLRRHDGLESPHVILSEIAKAKRRELVSVTAETSANALCEQLDSLLIDALS